MERSSHCVLCENHGIRKDGAFCKLTDAKPTFDQTCKSAQFDEILKSRIIKEITAVYTRKKKMPLVYTFAIVFSFIGGCVILLGTYFTHILYEYGVFATASLYVFFFGVIILGASISPLIMNLQKLKYERLDLAKTEEIVSAYQLKYSYSIKYGYGRPGEKVAKVDFKWEL